PFSCPFSRSLPALAVIAGSRHRHDKGGLPSTGAEIADPGRVDIGVCHRQAAMIVPEGADQLVVPGPVGSVHLDPEFGCAGRRVLRPPLDLTAEAVQRAAAREADVNDLTGIVAELVHAELAGKAA